MIKLMEYNGYKIIKEISILEPDKNKILRFVLGFNNNNAVARYVTWEHNEAGGYYWGHYFNDYGKALIDLYKRTEKELDMRIADYNNEESPF